MPKKPKLTVKEAKLVKGVVEGKSKTQAAISAGYSPNSAPQDTHNNISRELKDEK